MRQGKGSREIRASTATGTKVAVPGNLRSRHTANGILRAQVSGFKMPESGDGFPRKRESISVGESRNLSCEMPDAIRSGDVMLIAESALKGKAPMIRLIVHLPAEPAG